MYWTIAYGNYELRVHRRALTYRLTETKTQTVWAEDLSLGWVERENRETGEITRHDFGSLRCLSVSEKSGSHGKRILFGLDLDGVPIDLYLICSQREIQIQLEANRDSKTHRIAGFGLVPTLCAVPAGADGWLIFPQTGGTYLYAPSAVPSLSMTFQTWQDTSLPFIAATRTCDGAQESALVLMTDSVYSSVTRMTNALSFIYRRDPERRRLDLRCRLLPGGGPIDAALAYREKLIADNNHLTLRRKIRERPFLAEILAKPETLAVRSSSHRNFIELFTPETENRWEEMEEALRTLAAITQSGKAVKIGFPADWAAVAADFWSCETGDTFETPPHSVLAPGIAAVYRDCVAPVLWLSPKSGPRPWLRALLHLALPDPPVPLENDTPTFQQRCGALRNLYPLTFTAFLTEHRFLTENYLVEEAIYSDKTRVVINQSETEVYETEEFTLPPLGFYVRHSQMEAHDALRIGQETFTDRAWRIRRSRDGRPLEQSDEVERREFP